MPITLAVDIGSTYTKVVAIDCEGEMLVGMAQAPTTVSEGVMVGLHHALARLETACSVQRDDILRRVASSSAAGGLRRAPAGADADLVYPLDLSRIAALTSKGRP